MAKVKLPYTIKNNLPEFVRKKQALKTLEAGGSVTTREVENELAAYCGVTWSGIHQIKKGYNVPSLPSGFKIAEYFRADISKIFFLVDE